MTSTLHLRCPKKILRLSSASKPNAPAKNMWLVPIFLRVLGRNMENIKQENYKFKSRCKCRCNMEWWEHLCLLIWGDGSREGFSYWVVDETQLEMQVHTFLWRAVKSKGGWYNLKETDLKKPEYYPHTPVTSLLGRFQILSSSSRPAASSCWSPSPKWVLQ